MNLFRSEEHARNWTGFDDEVGLLPLEGIQTIFSVSRYRERLNGEYISRVADYNEERAATWKAVTNDHPFWHPA